MTINDFLKINGNDLETLWLMEAALKHDTAWILVNGKKPLNNINIKKLSLALKQKSLGYPTAYLAGSKEFYGLKFKVTKDTLIPRPETELMVTEIINNLKKNTTVIDVGCGSGCIIISAYRNTKIKNIQWLATDISQAALKIAKINAGKNKIDFFRCNLLSLIKKRIKYDNLIIAANLPYLPINYKAKFPNLRFEPSTALYAGIDGLKYYKQLLTQIKTLNFKTATILLEIDPGQSTALKKLIKAKITFKKDLAKKNRLVIIKK